jgi:hypothetical protein
MSIFDNVRQNVSNLTSNIVKTAGSIFNNIFTPAPTNKTVKTTPIKYSTPAPTPSQPQQVFKSNKTTNSNLSFKNIGNYLVDSQSNPLSKFIVEQTVYNPKQNKWIPMTPLHRVPDASEIFKAKTKQERNLALAQYSKKMEPLALDVGMTFAAGIKPVTGELLSSQLFKTAAKKKLSNVITGADRLLNMGYTKSQVNKIPVIQQAQIFKNKISPMDYFKEGSMNQKDILKRAQELEWEISQTRELQSAAKN